MQINFISIGFVVGLIFLILKLLGIDPVATWSWVWVLSPFWISWGIAISVLLFCIIFMLIFGGTILAAVILDEQKKNERSKNVPR